MQNRFEAKIEISRIINSAAAKKFSPKKSKKKIPCGTLEELSGSK
jgi:hypothetical protein